MNTPVSAFSSLSLSSNQPPAASGNAQSSQQQPPAETALVSFRKALRKSDFDVFQVADAICPPMSTDPLPARSNATAASLIEQCYDLRPSSEKIIKLNPNVVAGFNIDTRSVISAQASVKASAAKVESARRRVLEGLKDYTTASKELLNARRFLSNVCELATRAEAAAKNAAETEVSISRKRRRNHRFVDIEAMESNADDPMDADESS